MVEVCQAFPVCIHSSLAASRQFFILIAALRSVSLRLQSLNQKTLTDYRGCNGVFYTDSFFDFRFSF